LLLAPFARAFEWATVKRFLDIDDIESITSDRLAKLYRRNNRMDAARSSRRYANVHRRREKRCLRSFDGVFVCSSDDAALLRRMYQCPAFVLPNTVTIPPVVRSSPHETLTVLFVGSLDYHPNEDAALQLADAVLPCIHRSGQSTARALIVGNRPTDGVLALGLPLGAAILLGGILAPTDPVLASDVQVANPGDRDRLRFALTGEAGLNDGTAFPLVLLGLGLLGLHDIGAGGWRWLAVDVLWAVAGGIAIGAVLGTAVGQLVLYLRRTHKEAVGLDNFLALGLVGLTYGAANLAHAYGFLAVFAAGVALRRLEQQASTKAPGSERVDAESKGAVRRRRSAEIAAVAHADPDATHAEQVATDPKHAPAFMAHAMLAFNEQIERIGEVAAVMAVGMLLWAVEWRLASWGFVAALLLVIRPVAVAVGLIGSSTSAPQRGLIGWFGIRGIGSLYYLTYAMNHGLDRELAANLGALVFSAVVVSIVLHGVSVTPLMAFYERRKRRRARA
jgi:NhaP-type Na+/H+ or K+/H+ antiporter